MRTPKTVLLLLLTIALIRFEDDALAAVTRIEVVSSGPYGEFASGPYTRWDLRVAGELAPAAEAIRDLDKAGRNARGLVEYATRVTLIAPTNPARGNGTLHIDVPNRGRVIASSLYNGPRRDLIALGSFDPGTGFLEDCGYAIAAVTWELGFGVELPSFPGADGTPRFVEGTAFAIVRDVADFLSNGAADAKGRPNPLAGAIDRTLALGYSQTGRFLKSFLLGGFNMVGDHRVFAGMHILGAASGHIVLGSVPAPGSGAGAIPTFADPERRGVNEEPLALGDVMDQVSADSRPKMVFVNTTTDYFSLRGSLGRTGGVGGQDKRIPENVRVYDVAGASHALIPGKGECEFPFAVLDWHPVMRATLVALDQWVAKGVSPPANELMPLRTATPDLKALGAPKHLPEALIQVPVLDRDGNATGGVRLPDLAAPLGTHAVQNPPLSFQCSLGAGYVAFAKNKADREAANDARLSLAERYKDRNEYVNQMRAAARDLKRKGFLMSEDAAVIINAAAESTDLK